MDEVISKRPFTTVISYSLNKKQSNQIHPTERIIIKTTPRHILEPYFRIILERDVSLI